MLSLSDLEQFAPLQGTLAHQIRAVCYAAFGTGDAGAGSVVRPLQHATEFPGTQVVSLSRDDLRRHVGGTPTIYTPYEAYETDHWFEPLPYALQPPRLPQLARRFGKEKDVRRRGRTPRKPNQVDADLNTWPWEQLTWEWSSGLQWTPRACVSRDQAEAGTPLELLTWYW